jgi:hypothetical protein
MLLASLLILAACGQGDAAIEGDDANASGTELTGAAEDPAPEFASIAGWFNTEPLTLEDLRGQPVLIVFWSDT